MSDTEITEDKTTLSSASFRGYHLLWGVMFFGWLFAYADRAITGPIVTWMIDHNVGFLATAEHPHALGGLIGSFFFAGYMLTQLPSGRLGDRYSHSAMLSICFVWAAITTMASALVGSLFAFVALRVFTGLGEGAFYSNDRALIAAKTPLQKRSLGFGVAITGLACGFTVAFIAAPWLLNIGAALLGNDGWRIPFLFFGAITLLYSVFLIFYLRKKFGKEDLKSPLIRLLGMSVIFSTLIMSLFWLADRIALPEWASATAEVILALVIIAVTQRLNRSRTQHKPVSQSTNTFRLSATLPIYVAAIAIMWSIWLFGYWSVEIVASSANTSLMEAGLVAVFNAGAGFIGFPVGGWLSDLAQRRGWGRRDILIVATFMQGALLAFFGFYIQQYSHPSLMLIALLLFATGLFINAVQPMSQALTADLVPNKQHATAFGMWNMIAEIGALFSPVISGLVRDITGGWSAAFYVNAALVLASAFIYFAVNNSYESKKSHQV